MTSISAVNPLVFVEKESSFDRGLCTYRDFDSPSSKHPRHTVRVEKKTCFLRRFFFHMHLARRTSVFLW